MTPTTLSAEELRAEIIRLGPWHLDIDVTPEVGTSVSRASDTGLDVASDGSRPKEVSFFDPRPDFERLLAKIYPDGLEGRTFLDCACNCGAYSLLAREKGASECFGFDVREHWIRQARFLAEHRDAPTDRVHFEVLDLLDLPGRDVGPFDFTLFKGILYHLPDPVTGLKAAADLTREVIVVDSATRPDQPVGTFTVANEGTDALMAGVYELNWFPSGPDVVARVLSHLGFEDVRLVYNRERTGRRFGRMRVVAARREGMLDAFEPIDLGWGEGRQRPTGPRARARRLVRRLRDAGR